MKVKRAKTAGFCMGVSLALTKLENALQAPETKGRICTIGPIIHNPQALAEFEARGVVCISGPDDAQDNDHALIRAHGLPRELEASLREVCSQVEDATCPKVKKAQLAIARATAKGAPLLLFGDADHPEVAGLVSYAQGSAQVFGSEYELDKLNVPTGLPPVLASQTTQDRGAFEKIAEKLKNRFPRIKILATICDATSERQKEALRLAREVDVMVVVGGRTSGNTRRLASLAAEAGIDAWHVETVSELAPEKFLGKSVVGLTAGASTPKKLVDETEEWLAAL